MSILDKAVNRNLEQSFKKTLAQMEETDDGGESRYLEAMARSERSCMTEW